MTSYPETHGSFPYKITHHNQNFVTRRDTNRKIPISGYDTILCMKMTSDTSHGVHKDRRAEVLDRSDSYHTDFEL